MKLSIQGKNLDITSAMRTHVEEKIGKAVHHFDGSISKVDVFLSVSRNPRIGDKHAAEVIVLASGKTIRACVSSEGLYASIDLVADKIARQLRKYKERQLHKKTHAAKTAEVLPDAPVTDTLVGDREPELPSEVVRMKYFSMPPMSVEDALEQLHLVDHDFYMFRNAETGEINVIYSRNHGGFGLLQPRNNNGHTHGRLAHHDEPATDNGRASNGHAGNGRAGNGRDDDEIDAADYDLVSAYPPAQI